jgi:hypothetical protein
LPNIEKPPGLVVFLYQRFEPQTLVLEFKRAHDAADVLSVQVFA